MIMPRMVLVEDDSCTKTPGWVDTSSGNGDSGQVNQENSKSNGQWCQDLKIEQYHSPLQQFYVHLSFISHNPILPRN